MVTGVLALVVVVFGTIGFSRYDNGGHWYDELYKALQLFGFGGNVSGSKRPNFYLETARFLGPVVVGYAAVRGIVALYRQQLTRFWRRYVMRNHVVVAGLGVAGMRLADEFDRDNWRVVAIERDRSNVAMDSARARGIGVVHGDATAPDALIEAGARRANLLVVTCGDDALNIDVAAAAREAVRRRRRGMLTALVELDDFSLWQGMKAQAFLDRDEFPIRLEFFNVFALGAERLLDEHDPLGADDPHVLIFGMHGMGPSVVASLVRRWRGRQGRLRITFAGPLAEANRAEVVRQHPGIDREPGCELGTWNVEPAPHCPMPDAPEDVTQAFVCLSNETEALATALALRQAPALGAAPTVIVVDDEKSGVGVAVSRGLPGLENLTAFGALRRSLTPELLEATTTERIARRSHELHRQAQFERGQREEDVESLCEWSKLKHVYRESNRLFADGIPAALATIGCVIEPTPLERSPESAVTLTPEEVERLAPLEHERWEQGQKRLGFRHGPRRRTLPFYKRHPMIDVPYEHLPEENKEKDREHVRTIPDVLASVGFSIRRAGHAPTQAGRTPRATA